MSASYRHTQVGYLLLAVLSLGILGIGGAVAAGSAPSILMFVVVVLVLCLALFPTLTAVVENGRLRCFFGVGLIRREIRTTEILSVAVVRNSWVHGWGLRLIPGGWLWNVSGFDAVELRLKSGTLFRIGTDDPKGLHAALVSFVAKT